MASSKSQRVVQRSWTGAELADQFGLISWYQWPHVPILKWDSAEDFAGFNTTEDIYAAVAYPGVTIIIRRMQALTRVLHHIGKTLANHDFDGLSDAQPKVLAINAELRALRFALEALPHICVDRCDEHMSQSHDRESEATNRLLATAGNYGYPYQYAEPKGN